MPSRLHWKGAQLRDRIIAALIAALNEFNLYAEAFAKEQLYWRHGLRTGTLRRDITHRPAEALGNRITGSFGTSVFYAIFVHEGHHSFVGIPFLKIGFELAQPIWPDILTKHTGGLR